MSGRAWISPAACQFCGRSGSPDRSDQASVFSASAAGASNSGVDLGASENPVEPMLAEASATVAADAAPAGTEGAAEELLVASGEAQDATTEANDAVETEKAAV